MGSGRFTPIGSLASIRHRFLAAFPSIDMDRGKAGTDDADSTGFGPDEVDPGDIEPSDVDTGDIEPAGAMIAVAFTGAVLALFGFGLSFLVGDAALVFVLVGLVVVLASPVAYLRLRELRSDRA